MAQEIKSIRENTRRIKTHITNRYLKLADRVDEKGEGDLSEKEFSRYWELTKEFARAAIPKTTEITGEDGGAIEHSLSKEDKAKLDKILGTDSKVVEQVVNAEIAATEEGGE